MRILIISAFPPYPLTRGSSIRIFNLAKELRKKAEVKFLSLASSAQEMDALRDLQDLFPVDIVPFELKRNLKIHIRYFFSFHPYYRNVVFSKELAAKVKDLTSREKFDVVQVEGLWIAHLLDQIRLGLRVLDNHNVQTLYFKRLCNYSSARPKERILSFFDMLKLPRYERTYSERYDVCLCVSKVDLKLLTNMAPTAHYRVVNNGVDTEFFRPVPYDLYSKSVVHVGYYNNPNNVDAVVWFARKVFPLVLRQVPEAVFKIVGAEAPPAVRALDQGNTQVMGYIDDVRPIVQNAAVFVVPLRAGSGTRLKILEAMAQGKPIVSTSIGAEGLDLKDGEDVVIANTETELATSIVELLENPELVERIGKNARRTVEDKYSWASIGADLYDFYARLTGAMR